MEVPDMETVIERLLHEEQKLKTKNKESPSSRDAKEEVMTFKHKKKWPRCHFCKKFGRIQQNCHELEKKLALERGGPSSHESHRAKHNVNSVNARDQYDGTDSDHDEVGLVVQDQHALSVCVNNQADVEWIIDSGATCHVYMP